MMVKTGCRRGRNRGKLNTETRSSGGSAMLSEAWFGPNLQSTEKPALTVSVGKRKTTLKNVPYDGF